MWRRRCSISSFWEKATTAAEEFERLLKEAEKATPTIRSKVAKVLKTARTRPTLVGLSCNTPEVKTSFKGARCPAVLEGFIKSGVAIHLKLIESEM